MAENSKIEWTDHTFNPWIGCTKVSPACKNCYAERDFDHRYGKAKWGPNGTRVITSDANWKKPLAWDRAANADGLRRKVFCASLADVFEDWQGPILAAGSQPVILGKDGRASTGDRMTMQDVRNRLFELIDATPNLDWLLLTKRPENVAKMWPAYFPGGYIAEAGAMNQEGRRENVWLGTSIENQRWANNRLPYLHQAKRNGLVRTTFVSAEPLVGPVTLYGRLNGKTYSHLGGPGIDWVITGGESGPDARPCDPDWFRSLRDQCDACDVPFFFKQWGEFDEHQVRVGKKNAGRLLDGRTHDGFPLVQFS
jgi:protein gp37